MSTRTKKEVMRRIAQVKGVKQRSDEHGVERDAIVHWGGQATAGGMDPDEVWAVLDDATSAMFLRHVRGESVPATKLPAVSAPVKLSGAVEAAPKKTAKKAAKKATKKTGRR